MNLKKRLLAIALTAGMAVTAFGLTAFASSGDRIYFTSDNDTRFDEDDANYTLSVENRSGDDLYWYSSDERVATVNQNGTVNFHTSGTVTISARSESTPGLGDSITLTVRDDYYDNYYDYDEDYEGWERGDDYFYDPVLDEWVYGDRGIYVDRYSPNGYYYYDDEYYYDEYGLDRRRDDYAERRAELIASKAPVTNPSYSRPSTSTPVSTPTGSSQAAAEFSRTVNLTAVAGQTAVVNAASSSAAARLDNYGSVTIDVLKAAAAATKGVINFDTRVNGALMGRLQINPANAASLASGTIMLGVHYRDSATKSVSDTFNAGFSNEVHVIKCDQNSYGMSVKIFANIGAGVDAGNLVFYTYNAANNSYARLDATGVSVDGNGFLSFNTTTGGTIIISEGGALTK